MREKLLFWVETVLAVMFGFLSLLTLVWRDWIEAVFGVSPDHHSGSLEWLIVAALFVAAVSAGSRAHRRWRHLSGHGAAPFAAG